MRVGITGNIASGKTTLCEILEEMGFPLISADWVAHDLIHLPEVMKAFAAYDVFDETGKMDRRKLGRLVFSDDVLRKELEGFIHPIVQWEIDEFFKLYDADEVAFAEAPLLFEAGMAGQFDKVVLVWADDDVRLKRLMSRNRLGEAEARARMEAQESKVGRSDYVIYNNGDRSELERQVLEMLFSFYYQKGE